MWQSATLSLFDKQILEGVCYDMGHDLVVVEMTEYLFYSAEYEKIVKYSSGISEYKYIVL